PASSLIRTGSPESPATSVDQADLLHLGEQCLVRLAGHRQPEQRLELGDGPAGAGAHDAVNLDVIVAERLQALLNAPHRLISGAAERGGLDLRIVGLLRGPRRGRRRGPGRLRSLQTELAQQCRVDVCPLLEANDTPIGLDRRTRLRPVHSVYLTTVETQLAEHGLN